MIARFMNTFQQTSITTSTSLVPVSSETSLADLASNVRQAHDEVIGGLRVGAASAIRAGKALNTAKETVKRECGHGFWEDYVALECRLSMRTAQNYMKLARQEAVLDQLLRTNAQGSAFMTQAHALKFLSSAAEKVRAKRKSRGKI